MSNITEYISWRGDITFQQSPFNEVDNLIFSELIYIDFNKIVTINKIKLQEAINKYLEKGSKNKLTLLENPIPFLKELKDAKRFRNLKIFNYVNNLSKKEEKQFAAISIELNYNTVYIAFRGTDDTLLGWKEDFNLAFLSNIPSQLDAVNYINKVRRKYKNIIIGGHSKGGNLAVYAAVNCNKRIKKYIKKVYNNDGPGFSEDFIISDNYENLLKKIITIVPETSIIGRLLMHKGEYKVVKSSNRGIWQHDALSWQVEGNHFITIENVNDISNKINFMFNEWLIKIGYEDRKIFVNNLFCILEKNNIKTVEDLSKLPLIKIPKLVRSFQKLEEESKKIMINLLKDLVKEAKKNFDTKTIIKGITYIGKKS